MEKNIYFLDIETTGLSSSDKIVEIALLDSFGYPVIDTLIDPQVKISNGASKVHRIFNKDVDGYPIIDDVLPGLYDIINGSEVVIYNALFDTRFLPGIRKIATIKCAMNAFSEYYQSNYGLNYLKRFRLVDALNICGINWAGNFHRAKDDAEACRLLWSFINNNGVFSFNIVNDRFDGDEVNFGALSNIDGDGREYNHIRQIIDGDCISKTPKKFNFLLSVDDSFLFNSIFK